MPPVVTGHYRFGRQHVYRRVDRFIEMPRFDGTGDSELFLRCFRLAKYYGWNGEEKLFRLSNCIHGDAQYVLLDLDYLDNVDVS
jgi:hypothetical protein